MNAGVDLGDDGTYALDAGMALNVPGYPAIPPMPTTVAATNTQHMLMYAAAYHLTLVEFAVCKGVCFHGNVWHKYIYILPQHTHTMQQLYIYRQATRR